MFENLFSSFAKIKDYLLAIVALDYGIGLVSWNIYSYSESLGINSAFELQYFLAGFVPLLILTYYIWIIRYGRLPIDKIRGRLSRKAKSGYKVLRSIIITFFFLSIISLPLLAFLLRRKNDEVGSASDLSIMLAIIVFCICGILMPKDAHVPLFYKKTDEIRSNISRLRIASKKSIKQASFQSATAKICSFLITINLLILYYVLIYPFIPQELGGVKPRKCIFISKEVNLFHSSKMDWFVQQDSISASFTSIPVYVYFYNGTKLIIKNKMADESVYEIDRKNIDAIIWIDK